MSFLDVDGAKGASIADPPPNEFWPRNAGTRLTKQLDEPSLAVLLGEIYGNCSTAEKLV